jgi:ribosome hibernation promoting factor
MRIEFTGRHEEVPADVRARAERKLRKLAKVLRGITDVHVVVAADKHRHVAEVTVHSPRQTLTAAEASGDLAVALTTVIDRLTRQAQRHMGKLRERKRRGRGKAEAEAPASTAGPAPRTEGGPRVIRSRGFLVKPMTVDEAVLEVGGSGDGFLVFRDAATERVSVLYRRKDGNLGLIEPEA